MPAGTVKRSIFLVLGGFVIFHFALTYSRVFSYSYDAQMHLYFSSHYLTDWLNIWDMGWYGGFQVTSYPPLTHQLTALLVSIAGVEADRRLSSRMRLGRISYTVTKENAERAPNNPRTRLQWGIVLFYTPKWFGGGSDPAIEQLEVAHANFEMQRTDAPWPNWGAHEAQVWLGMALARGGRPEEARAIYQRVLEREPAFEWAKQRLVSLDAAGQ